MSDIGGNRRKYVGRESGIGIGSQYGTRPKARPVFFTPHQAYAPHDYNMQNMEFRCPISGAPALTSPQATVTLKGGQTVHFCCSNCPDVFRGSPAQFIEGASSSAHNKFYLGREMHCPVMTSNFKVGEDTAAVKLKNGQVRVCFQVLVSHSSSRRCFSAALRVLRCL